jgi:hypothetical protein
MGARNIRRLWQEAFAQGDQMDLASGDTLELKPEVDDQGALNIGDGTTDMDFKVFLGATTAYVEANVGDGQVNIEGAELHLGDNDAVELGDGNDVVLKWNGTHLEGGNGTAGTDFTAKLPSKADGNDFKLVNRVRDQFIGGLATTREHFVFLNDGASGTPALRTDTVGGVLNIVTAAADNDYHALSSGLGSFDFVNAKEFWARCRFRLAEATTNESAIWFGVTSDVTTGGFQANAAGPLATYDGVMMWKDEATLSVDSETSNAGTQDTNAAISTMVSNTWYEWAIHVDATATTAVATFYVDGVVAGATSNLTRAGLVPGALVLGVKAGPTAAAETLQVDYIEAIQIR